MKEITYTQAVAEIEAILESINQKQLDVDTLVEKVKRATELLNACREKLLKVEGEVVKVLEQPESDR